MRYFRTTFRDRILFLTALITGESEVTCLTFLIMCLDPNLHDLKYFMPGSWFLFIFFGCVSVCTHTENNFWIAFSLYQCAEINYRNTEVLGAGFHKAPLFLGIRYYLLAVFCNDFICKCCWKCSNFLILLCSWILKILF